jgi:antitoxin component YwqK of YwqJK toxin-antitoxin module
MNKGKTDGFEKEFYESGQLQSITKYNNGIKIESKKVYYPNGNLKAKIRFNDKGNLDGTTQEYYGNGNKKFSVRMNNGLVRDGYMYTRSGDRRKMNAEDYDKLGLK